MTTKAAILSTVGIVLGALVVGLVLLFLYVSPGTRGANGRAELLGQGMAFLCLIPLGAVWIMWAARFRKDREREQAGRSGKR